MAGILGFAIGLGTGLAWKRGRGVESAAIRESPVLTKSTARERQRHEEITKAENAAREQERARNTEQAKQEAMRRNFENSKALSDGAMQLGDDALREASIRKIREAVLSGNETEVLAGLSAFNTIQELDFDKASFRQGILQYLDSKNSELRTAAAFALLAAGIQPGDASSIREIARTSGYGDRTSYLLFRFEKGDLTGESGEIVRELLSKGDGSSVRECLRGMWGARMSPLLEADIIAMSRDPNYLHDSVYFALSTQQNKSAACIARLIEVLGDADSYNNGGRAAWGLGQGVATELSGPVAEAAMKIVSTRSSGYLEQQAWGLVKQYAGPAQLEALRNLAAKPNLPAEKRQIVETLIQGAEGAQK